MIKDSGQARVFESGAQRDAATGKARFDLLPVTALERVSKHYAAGAAKYGENNWRLGMPRAELLKSGLRHLFYLLRGDTDEDHAAACVWNVLNYIETVELDLDKEVVRKFPECPECGSTSRLHAHGCRTRVDSQRERH